jgi:RimJ/RimL family protein N-acetyltransferase
MGSKRIRLINCDRRILESILDGKSELSQLLGVHVPSAWSEFGRPVFEYSLKRINSQPSSEKWWTYLVVHIKSNSLMGSCGFKGEPDENGGVEIGYEVAKEFRNQGFATEMVALLVTMAFESPGITCIQAQTLAEKNASVTVLEKNRFEFVGEIKDEEDGIVWKWVLKA